MTTNISPERMINRKGYHQILNPGRRYDRQRRKTANVLPTAAPHRHLLILIISVLLHCHNICHSLLINTAKTKNIYFSTLQQPTQRLKIPHHHHHHTQHLHPLSAATTTSSSPQSLPPLSSWTRPTLALAIPSLIGMMADPLLSLIDTFFVSQLGPTPLAALGASTSIFHLAFNTFRATTTATTSLVASSHPPSSRARFVTRRSLSFGVGMGVLVGMVLVGGHAGILTAMNAGGSLLFGPARSYLLVRACAAPAVLYCVVSEGAFRGYGDTTVPLVASGVAAGLNLVLDPVLMFGCGMGVGGAALATALSQVGAMLVYRRFLKRRGMVAKDDVVKEEKMMMNNVNVTTTTTTTALTNNDNVIATIIRANLAMMCKQGSLLLAWAYATARATKIGREHVAAHQVALSFWLIFALIMDGAAVAAQVLMSRIYGSAGGGSVEGSSNDDDGDSTSSSSSSSSLNYNARGTTLSLTKYMALFASLQGVLSSVVVGSLGHFVPGVFSPDPLIRRHLKSLIPILAGQQILISWTLVMESLVAGSQQFRLLAIGTALSTVWSMSVLSKCTDIVGIWRWGIVTLFFGRLLTALVGVVRILMGDQRKKRADSTKTIS